MELREKIEEELEKNPALEVLADYSVVSLDDAERTISNNLTKEEDVYFGNTSDSGYISREAETASEEKQKFLEGVISHPESLQEHLLWQLRLESMAEEKRKICEILVQNLDSDGFIIEPLALLLADEDDKLIEEAVKLIQELDPPGTCTIDYRESLLVQVRLLSDAPPGIEEALMHLDLLEKEKFSEAAKLMSCTEDHIKIIFDKIKELSPFPGRGFSRLETRYVVPDIQVIKKEGEYLIILNEEEIPVLGINPFFIKVSGDAKVKPLKPLNADKPVRDFARENIKEARWFINAINQRNHTLLRVTRAVVEFQRSFFANGPKYLAPLTLKDIADELGLHKATISRTANGKYIQTEWGIFEIKHFFSNSISGTGSGGSGYSKEGVKENIREIIESELSKQEAGHLSDMAIVDLLEKRGIKLARRTVAKYRSELGLGSSFIR